MNAKFSDRVYDGEAGASAFDTNKGTAALYLNHCLLIRFIRIFFFFFGFCLLLFIQIKCLGSRYASTPQMHILKYIANNEHTVRYIQV